MAASYLSDPSCIFCRIVAGQIPALKVFEDDRVLAFLDIGPLANGHVLLIPKDHHRDLRDLPPETLAVISGHLPRLAQAVMTATGATGLNLLQNSGASSGQAVFHVHFHLRPRRDGDGLGYLWNAGSYAAGAADAWQRKIVDALPQA